MQRNNILEIIRYLMVLGFIIVLTMGGILLVIMPKSGISEIEKRELAKFPDFSFSELLAGKYTKALSLYVSDNFPFRDSFVNLSASVKELYGVTGKDNIKIHQPNTPPLPPTPPPATSGNPTSSVPDTKPEPTEEEATGQNVNGIFIYNGKALQMFGGNSRVGTQYANAINNYNKMLGDNVQVYNLIIPSAIEFALPEKYKSVTTPERPKIQEIYDQLDDDIIAVDVYDSLYKHKKEYLYFNTDHHWTSLGAYYAYTEFAKSAGFTPVDIKKMKKKTLPEFLGTLYSKTKDSSLKENKDFVEYYTIDTPHSVHQYVTGSPYSSREISLYGEYAKNSNSYSVFLHGDWPMLRIDTQLKNGRKILVMKESYGNAFIPFLVNHYEKIIVVDPRYFQRGVLDVVRDFDINEVLFINNSFAASTSSQVALINKAMYPPVKPQTPPQIPPQSSSSIPETPPDVPVLPVIPPDVPVLPVIPPDVPVLPEIPPDEPVIVPDDIPQPPVFFPDISISPEIPKEDQD